MQDSDGGCFLLGHLEQGHRGCSGHLRAGGRQQFGGEVRGVSHPTQLGPKCLGPVRAPPSHTEDAGGAS